MNGELSNSLPRLATRGRAIVERGSGRPLLLRGINRSGFEYSVPNAHGFAAAAGITQDEIEWIARDWNANILRIPFNQDWALNGRGGRTGEQYLADLDGIIHWASCCQAYTLLDLQWLGADRPHGPDNMMVPPLPDGRTAELWRLLARRYREEPAVLIDLFNEPHDRIPQYPYPLQRPDGSAYPLEHSRVSMTEWQEWALFLIDAIQEEHPESLIFVSGTDWAYDLRGFPLERENLVYSTHIYPSKGRNWGAAFGYLARFVPVFAAEFGGGEGDLAWGERLLRYLSHLEIGWTAWSWSDNPRLARNRQPTQFGNVVRSALRKPPV